MAFPVLSTYRLQLRGRSSGFGFTFAEAENLLDYLDDLGVSHLYLSPIITAVGGSSHGYDVTDPTTVSPELGGPDGLARLAAGGGCPRTRNGPGRRHRPQPCRGRQARAERLVVGRLAARADVGLCGILRYRLGLRRRPNCVAAAGFRRRYRRSRGRRRPAAA